MELYRILSGKLFVRVSNDLVCVHPPDAELRYLADFLSQEVYDQAIAAGAFTLDELNDLLRDCGLWSDEDDKLLEQILRDINNCKSEYFRNFHFKRRLQEYKKNLREQEKLYQETITRKLYLSEYTAENAQLTWKESYIYENTAKLESGGLAVSRHGIGTIMHEVRNNQLEDVTIRSIAKSHHWRAMWNGLKVGISPFENKHLTDDQLQLITWSKTYDSIYESMECPSEDVINDDVALDGWFITQAQKRKSERAQENGPQAAEVFVPTNFRSTGKVDKSDVINMNSSHGKQIMKHKLNEVKQRGSMNELDYSGTRTEIQMHANSRGVK